jgi:hypothetical protein
VDPNAPNPLQAARQDYMIKLLRSKTEADMVKEQNRIMRDALNDFRPVFAVLQPGSVGAFRKFITPEFEMTRVDQWKELARVPIERSVGPLDPGSRGMPFYPNRGAQTWQLYRITKKPPRPVGVSTTKPSTAPTTAPTTAPLALVAPATTPTGKPTSAPTTQTADASR